MYVVVELPGGELVSYPEGSMFEYLGGMICVRSVYEQHGYGVHPFWVSAKMMSERKKLNMTMRNKT